MSDHIQTITAGKFTQWFASAKPGEKISYYIGPSFIADAEKNFDLDKLRDAIWKAAFEVSVPENRTRWHDKKTLFLLQRRVGAKPKPEDNKAGLFEYLAIRRRGES
jgi:hypothetical protein